MCPGPSVMARAVEKRLGHPVFVPPARADLSVEAYVERGDAGWRVDITLSSADQVMGHRDLVDQEASCDRIAESAVLAIALMIDPDAVLRPEPPPPAPPPVPPQPAPERAPTPAPPPSAPWRGAAEVAAGVATGLLPEIAPGIFVRGRATLPSRRWAFELEGAYFFKQSVAVGQREQVIETAEFSAFFGGLSFCWLPELSPAIGVITCGGANVEVIHASASGFEDSQPTQQSLVLNLAAKGRLSFRVAEHWLLLVGADLFIPLSHDSFQANPGGSNQEVFQVPIVAGAFEVGFALEF